MTKFLLALLVIISIGNANGSPASGEDDNTSDTEAYVWSDEDWAELLKEEWEVETPEEWLGDVLKMVFAANDVQTPDVDQNWASQYDPVFFLIFKDGYMGYTPIAGQLYHNCQDVDIREVKEGRYPRTPHQHAAPRIPPMNRCL